MQKRTTLTFGLCLLLGMQVGLAQSDFGAGGGISVNGDLSEPEYVVIGSKQNANSGFGPNIDVQSIRYYADEGAGVLYIGVEGKLDVVTTNSIGLWLDFSEQTLGRSAGSNLGADGLGQYMDGQGGGTDQAFRADFQVDYMFGINPASNSSDAFVDAAKWESGTATGDFLGNPGQSGAATTNGNATLFPVGSVTIAFNNGGGVLQGFEMAIPYSALGVSSSGTVNAFAMVVSSTGFFSDVTVPGNVTGGNPGFNADFCGGALAAGCAVAGLLPGPFNTGPQPLGTPLPVELTAFAATVEAADVVLRWETATETDNAGFHVEMKRDIVGTRHVASKPVPGSSAADDVWESIGFVDGHGTTTEPNGYAYRVADLTPGTYRFRLKQTDFDGTVSYSETVEALVEVPGAFVLEHIYPNPFNPSANVRFAVAAEQAVTLGLYDALGRQVRTLFTGRVQANDLQTVQVDGANLPSGVYLVRLQGETFTATQTATLMK